VIFNSFLVGAFLEQTAGNYLKIPCPSFMKSLLRMSSRVGLSAGFLTSIFLIRAMAYGGVCAVLGIL
jgi:hypothetical protein